MGLFYHERIVEEDEVNDTADVVQYAPASSGGRWERIPRLSISDFEDDRSPGHGQTDHEKDFRHGMRRSLRRRISAKRSITSLLIKPINSSMPKHASTRASAPSLLQVSDRETAFDEICSQSQLDSHDSIQSIALLLPTFVPWETQQSQLLLSLTPDSSSEDLTTYHANLRRFKKERAIRAVELGFGHVASDTSSDENSIGFTKNLEPPPLRHVGSRNNARSSGRRRGLRAYWGGGASSYPDDHASDIDRSRSAEMDLGLDEEMDREALRQWWDRLGSDKSDCC